MKSEPLEISRKSKLTNRILTVIFSVISVIYVLPIVIVIMNSFKFNEYVKNNEKDKYVIQETNVVQEKDFSANMMDRVSLERE